MVNWQPWLNERVFDIELSPLRDPGSKALWPASVNRAEPNNFFPGRSKTQLIQSKISRFPRLRFIFPNKRVKPRRDSNWWLSVLVRSTLPLERLHNAHSILSVGTSIFFGGLPSFSLLETELKGPVLELRPASPLGNWIVVRHNYAWERAQKPCRHARMRGAKEIKRDETVQEI